MRASRTYAYGGHTYYLLLGGLPHKFAADPERYLDKRG